MNVIIIFLLVLIGLVAFFTFIGWIVWITGESDNRTNPKQLPPPPQPFQGQFVLQFINQTNQTLLLGADGPTLPITPRNFPVSGEKWTLPPGGNIVVDIPRQWEGANHPIAPRFWVRTGCRYDPISGFAQCESGDCNLNYDCLTGGQAPVSLVEFCFNCGQFGDQVVYDVSLVDGSNVTVDIIPIGASSTDPHNPTNPHWNITNICNMDGDVRSVCPRDFQIKSSDLSTYIPGQPDNIVACLSNCGRAAYPTIPTPSEPRHADWVKYCCQEPATPCTNDSQCPSDTVCWSPNNLNQTCQCRGWIRGASCSPDVCTFQNEEPPFGQCTNCVGDDTFHSVCPYAYSWPNENQNQNSNAKVYQIVFMANPGIPITPTSSIPMCNTLPAIFNPSNNIALCGTNLGQFSGAHKTTQTPSVWDCNISLGQNTTGVLCRNR